MRIVPTGSIEFIMLNVTDPAIEVDGERASIKTKHPLFGDPAVRQAIKLLMIAPRSRSSSTAAPRSPRQTS